MAIFSFKQVDVFSSVPLKGNPLAVVIGAEGLNDAQMSVFANWTNLSETTFLLPPTVPEADYRVRIFTPHGELPFAGHPTLGTCHAWLEVGGAPKGREVVQECAAGLVRVRRENGELAFAAPPLCRSGPVDPELMEKIRAGLHITPEQILASAWVDNGPGWLALRLSSREEVLAAKPDFAALDEQKIGLVGPWEKSGDDEPQFELRAFSDGHEDPVTGSLNASVAQWLMGSGVAPDSYIASQGTALGRAGRISLTKADGEIWVGGAVTTLIDGSLKL
ncbi:PhzF family phenazine biosynthesis protein [Kozakia baliensis]|uniref:Phenazine biosynthesis protein PhzF n=1 Tax=Kozakia baliensis TaxID=153496 RepID=A0A1D8UVE0_9PROT|nr:PhzF family phenazine biosynthesis protein [Kozakia baliensis]AOX17619.1 phenazine biosynthesis protein PhzF [Kozakia baliensis]GBR31210.1 phenazine biosynthesis PhzC/PhzF protein [Kozakia baliensis NRIC 0488]GEL62896.1 phenazine biosynthesis protein PhzF [Kozakia baliensis]